MHLKKGLEASYQSTKMFAWHKMDEYKRRERRGILSSELLVNNNHNLARKFAKCSNDTYLCMHLKKVRSLLIKQRVCLDKMKEYKKKEKKRNVFWGELPG